MSFLFSKFSNKNLATAHPDLRRLFEKVIEFMDCRILGGVRSIEEQRIKFKQGLSKTMNSKHLANPETGLADAVDAAPFPERWEEPANLRVSKYDLDQIYFGGFVMGVAAMMGIPLRYGGDWDRDDLVSDERFRDLDHFERDVKR